MKRQNRLWFPLDVNFWDDPDIVTVGDSAAILFLRLIAYAKKHQTDGAVPMAAVRAIGGRRWEDKLKPLLGQGLVSVSANEAPDCGQNVPQSGHKVGAQSGAKWCQIVAYLAWNDSSTEIEKRREINRQKKRSQRSAKANVPGGHPASVPAMSPSQEVELETETDLPSPSEKVPSSPPASTVSRGPSVQDQIRGLSNRYPSSLLSEVREAVALKRQNGKVSNSVWLKFLRQLEPHPVEAVTAAMRTFCEKYADGEKGEAYLLGIVRSEAKKRAATSAEPVPATPAEAFGDGDDPLDVWGPETLKRAGVAWS